jgi:putative hydrolase of the HAD superfamily
VPSELKTILFDLDGTLYVSAPLGVEIRLSASGYIADLKGVGIEAAELLIRATQKRLSAASGCDTSLSLACQELGGELRELHRHFAAEIRTGPFLARDERVVELLKTLGRKFELYIYTNNNKVLTAGIMNSLGIAGLFRQVFTIEDFWIAKPDRGTLAAILGRIGRLPQECLFVGDRFDIDLRLPAEMGCAVFLVSSTEELFSLCKLMSEENV